MASLLLLEDDTAIAEPLRYALERAGHQVTHLLLGSEVVARVAADRPDLLILDVGLPDISGFEVLARVRRESRVPVLMLTARSEEVDRMLGFELGADDYVPKPFSPREVVARVAAILRRAQALPASALAAGDIELDEVRARVTCRGTPLALTRYEYLLLAAFMRAPERVFSRGQLMEMVWSHDVSQERTVDTHIKSLRAKIREAAPDLDPIQTHRGLGYSWQP
ncbi:MAG: two-component system response regulator [Moraxellaceae bacterium]|jgi:two-component system catabolic regulation response regulator CreB|nr:two-component system response regulator [Moraxellaceae bacterium]